METTTPLLAKLHSNPLKNSVSLTLKQQIMNNILEFHDIQKKKRGLTSRNLLNKWFQDSVKNYLMEAHVAPLLMDTLSMHSIQEIKMHIHKKLDRTIPKYMGVLKAYYEALKQAHCGNILEQNLINIITKNSQDLKPNSFKMDSKNIRKRFMCLLILTYFQENGSKEIDSFYDIWNICFLHELRDLQRQTKKNIPLLNSQNYLFSNELQCEQTREKVEQDQESSSRDTVRQEESSQEQKNPLDNFFLPAHGQNKQFNSDLSCACDFERENQQANYDINTNLEITSYPLPEMNGYLDPSFIPDSYNFFFMDEPF